jgi:NAD(P)-dependent dehydrogenase (short-subunit alcohol dehydrogenase family)
MLVKLDLLDTLSVQSAVRAAIERFGHLHSVVYAAGPPLEYAYINEIKAVDWARVTNTDVNGCFNLVEATLPHLRERKNGNYLAVITAAVDMNVHTRDYVDRMIHAFPLKRAGTAQEVADVAVFLLSHMARYVTGVSIPVAGGLQLA